MGAHSRWKTQMLWQSAEKRPYVQGTEKSKNNKVIEDRAWGARTK